MKSDFTCGFIGLGLIGGSIARAIRQFYPSSRLLAYDLNQETLKTAVSDGVIDLALPSIDEAFAQFLPLKVIFPPTAFSPT